MHTVTIYWEDNKRNELVFACAKPPAYTNCNGAWKLTLPEPVNQTILVCKEQVLYIAIS